MLWLRSLLFNIVFYGWSLVLCLATLWVLLLPRSVVFAFLHGWMRQLIWIEEHIAGIRYQVVGWENVPEGACIIAAKHQSAWETFKMPLLFGNPAIVLKQEIAKVPIVGWYGKRTGMIPIDRSGGAKTMQIMKRAAHQAVTEGRKIIIFPEGTRVPVGEHRPLKGGVSGLYQELNIPLVPMALNSGLLWPKNSFIKKSGLITIELLPPIPAGLPRGEMMQRLESQLEAASNRLAGPPIIGIIAH